MGLGGRGLSCGRCAASLRLTGFAGHRRFAPDASNPAVPTQAASQMTRRSRFQSEQCIDPARGIMQGWKQPPHRHCVFRSMLAFLVGCSALGPPYASAQEKALTPRSGFVTSPERIKIHYIEAGHIQRAANSPSILFVPGWTMPADIWEHQIAYFSKATRVVAMEPRSYGLSSQTTEGNYPEAHARDIKAVLDRLRLRPVVLVGWSLGVDDVVAYIDQFGTDGVTAVVLIDEVLVFQRDSDFMKSYFDFTWNLQTDRPAATA